MEKIYDVIIIGAGPAGLAAAIYAQRAKIDALVIEKEYISGGQILNTDEVDNYPGISGISGYELSLKLRQHADSLGAEFLTALVARITGEGEIKTVETDQGNYDTKSVILAMGAVHQELGVKGEKDFAGMGVSYCAICDGAFFRGRTVAVVGGGDVAVEDALFLARNCEKVWLIHRRDELRAAKSLQEKLFAQNKIEILWDSQVNEICGEEQVEAIKIEQIKTGAKQTLHLDGIFIAVGIKPNSELANDLLEMDERGYICAGETCETSAEGIFAAGDIRTKELRQIITAAADGANAISAVQKYLLQSGAL